MSVLEPDDMDLFHEWVGLAESEGPDSAEASSFADRHAGRVGFLEMVQGWRAGERILPSYCDYADENFDNHPGLGAGGL